VWHHAMRKVVGSQRVVPLWEEDSGGVLKHKGHLVQLSKVSQCRVRDRCQLGMITMINKP